MSSDLYLAYLNERYKAEEMPLTLQEIAEKYEQAQEARGVAIFKTPKGFTSYTLKGDAMIIYDIYVKREYRGTKEARRMFDALEKFAQEQGKRILVGFSEYTGKNRELGITAMLAGGFVPAYETKTKQIYVKGI